MKYNSKYLVVIRVLSYSKDYFEPNYVYICSVLHLVIFVVDV